MFRSFLFCTLLFVACLALARAADTRAFMELNRIVVMEVESAPLAGSWARETGISGYIGSCYYTWRGGGVTSITSAGQGVLAYKFKITHPGEYSFRFHNYHNYPDDQTQQNDTWVKMDNGSWTKCYQSGGGKWNFLCTFEVGHDHVAPAFNLSAGYHTLCLSGRSHGHSVDRIHLYQVGMYGSIKLDQPESVREGDAVPEDKKVEILSPAPGTALVPGQAYTFTGSGTVVFWSHDVGDDGTDIVKAGNRNERSITIPADATDKIAVILDGSYGQDKAVYPISQTGITGHAGAPRLSAAVEPGVDPMVRLRLPRADRMEITLFAADGQLVSSEVYPVLDPGDHAVRTGLAGMPAGMYLVRISGEKCGTVYRRCITAR